MWGLRGSGSGAAGCAGWPIVGVVRRSGGAGGGWQCCARAPLSRGRDGEHADGLAEVGDEGGHCGEVLGQLVGGVALLPGLLEQRGPQLEVVPRLGGLLLHGEDLCELVRVGLGRAGELGAVFGEHVAEQLCGASGLCFDAGLQLVPVLLQELCNAGAVLGVELLEAVGFLVGARGEYRGEGGDARGFLGRGGRGGRLWRPGGIVRGCG